MKRIAVALLLTVVALSISAQPARENIAPMLKSTWRQDAPYNQLCPMIGGAHCQTGCVATAMAQIMRYHQWPEQSLPIPGYQTEKVTVEALPATAFDWSLMLDKYDNTATEAQRHAVALLMLYCGAAVTMDYGIASSAAWEGDAPVALAKYFGYAASARELFRYMYDDVAWQNIIYGELRKGRPVMYGAMPAGYEHQFVCDGYQDGKYHMNMAWGMKPDGYYAIDDIDDYGFHMAVVGIQKADGVEYGKTFTQGALTYTIIDRDAVSVLSLSDATATAVSIPSSVDYQGTTYRVTTIDYEAFANNGVLQSLSIPATVNVITREAIKNCTRLTTITVAAANDSYHMVDGQLMTITNSEVVAQQATALSTLQAAPTTSRSPRYYTPHGMQLNKPCGIFLIAP